MASTASSRAGSASSGGTRKGIPAARILCFARTSRWAIAASLVRKARAISGVVSPPSRRSVSATCASVASAGWQHVKISASRSSGIVVMSSSSSSSGASAASRASSSCLVSRVRRRRSRSIARFRAVVTIQAPGFAGTPSRGQRSAAIVNASWTASSARSKSPSAPIRIETARPNSSRNAWATGSAATPRSPRRRRPDAPRSTRTARPGCVRRSRSPRPRPWPRSGSSRRAAPWSPRRVRR